MGNTQKTQNRHDIMYDKASIDIVGICTYTATIMTNQH